MTCLKGVRRSAMVALAPDAPYVAAGTMAGAFSSSANLEIFELHFQSYDWELPLAGEAPSSEHFNRLSWGRAAAGSASEHFSLGLVAGGLVDGTINIWNPLTLIRPEANGNALVGHLSRHRGPVRGLEFNAIAPNLLGSGADDGEICIWDMANPAEPSHFTPPRGGGSTSQGEISFLSWNSNETHILASTSYNGTTVVWDLKKQKPVIGFSDSVRRRCSVLQWNPDVATQLVVASDEDSLPSVRLWDTRNTMSPVKEFAGHTKGVIAMAWCPDSSYLITCAKDSRTICWDTVSGEIVCELPAGNNWNFDVHWYPKIPGVISASSFDGKVGFYNIEGCSRYSVGENEFGAEGQMKNKEEELNSIIMELRKNYASLQEKSTEEEMETLAAVDSLAKLKEARLNFEGSLSEEPSKAQRELLSSNLKQLLKKFIDAVQKCAPEVKNLLVFMKELEEQYSSQNDEIRRLQNKLATAENDEIRRLQNKLATVEEKLQLYSSYAPVTRTEFEGQKKLTNELKNRLADAELKVVEGEKLCKKLHNTILELKGNIRVFCRVRPVLPVDGGISTEGNVLSYPTSIERIGRGIDVEQSGQKHAFTFDQVFMPDTTQADVFVQISELVQSALDGYKVCIFAYGQKGSGKTYTMMGRPGHPEQKGLIPRSLEQIFQTRQSLQPQGWRYEMQVSILEIYNETIRDLISTIQSSATEGKQYAIKHDANGNTYVSDLTIVDVCSAKEVSFLLDQAVQSRSVGKTQMNEQSSRSHFVFMLRILGLHESTKQQVKGVLNLIDLAGSERLSNSGATGDQLKETQAINKSLSFLSDVILALEKKEDHIPFRNSKLTYLLQPCLGGDSKTLMFVNVSSNPSSVGESLCALRFAARVNACEIGIPQRQTNMRPSDSLLRNG